MPFFKFPTQVKPPVEVLSDIAKLEKLGKVEAFAVNQNGLVTVTFSELTPYGRTRIIAEGIVSYRGKFTLNNYNISMAEIFDYQHHLPKIRINGIVDTATLVNLTEHVIWKTHTFQITQGPTNEILSIRALGTEIGRVFSTDIEHLRRAFDTRRQFMRTNFNDLMAIISEKIDAEITIDYGTTVAKYGNEESINTVVIPTFPPELMRPYHTTTMSSTWPYTTTRNEEMLNHGFIEDKNGNPVKFVFEDYACIVNNIPVEYGPSLISLIDKYFNFYS